MTVPKSLLTNLILDVVKSQNEKKAIELVDLIIENINEIEQHNIRISENSEKVNKQHEETMHVIELMKQGFKNVDKRFDDVNKRFEDVNKRFDDVNKRFVDVNKRFDDVNMKFKLITWLIGIGFVSVNILIAVLKFFVK